ncbi:MAG: NAD(P)-dependent oxidoreductase [Rhodospirillaceae bacterium]|nr:NAD(P)-dependent oxidoreductase [Rhodospirillaceae bacterium]
MRIAVIGSTGVLGRHLVPRLIERGHAVCATARKPADLERLKRLGAEAVAADIFDIVSLRAAVVNCDAAIHAATSIPKPAGGGDWAVNDRIRREGTANLIEACRAERVRRYVQQSVAMLHIADDSRPQNEDDPVSPYDRIRSAAEMEQMVQESGLDWCIVRGGAFYGPGTGRAEAWRSQARGGVLVAPGDGNGFISLIHVADMASAMALVAERGLRRQVYIAADDQPATYRDLLGYVAAMEGTAPPAVGGQTFLPSFRVSNAKLKALGWAPGYPSFRSGLVA